MACSRACRAVAMLAFAVLACCQPLQSNSEPEPLGAVGQGSLQSVQPQSSLADALALQSLGASANCSSTTWICPGCQVVSIEVMSSIASQSCRPAPGSPSTQLIQCGGERVREELVSLIQQNQCHPACSWRASQHCSQQRALLQAADEPPASFVASPAVPVSTASPFLGLPLGPLPAYAPGSSPLSTTRWLCGSTLLSPETFHGLRIAIEDDVCTDQTAQFATACSSAPDPSPSSSLSPSTLPVLPVLPKATAQAPVPSSCPGAGYICGENGQLQASAGLYAAVLAASGCAGAPESDTCTVGGYLVDPSLFSAIKGGTCKQDCQPSNPIAYTQAPALAVAPALVNSLAPAMGPAQPPCQSYVCGNQTLAADLYKAITPTSKCQSPLQGSCLVGSSLVDASLFTMVQAGSCHASCASDQSLAPCQPPAAGGQQCSQPGYTCSSQRITSTLFKAINSTSSCSTAAAGFCMAGDSVVDLKLYQLVASGVCTPTCLDLLSVACTGAGAPGSQPAVPARTPACSPETFTCGAQQSLLVPAKLFYAASAATDCKAISDGMCTVAGSILDNSTWAAIKGGTCKPVCGGGPQVPCPAAAPAQSPEASCSIADVVCSGNETFHMQPELYAALLGLSSCSGGLCLAGSFIAEEPLWQAVHAGRCSPACAVKDESCAAAAPAPAPEENVAELSSNLLQISGFVLDFEEWSTCEQQCSNFTQQRVLICRSLETDLPVELTNCNYTLSDLESLSRPCGKAACSPYSWHADPWGECSETCGLGTTTRNVTCLYNGHVVPDDTPGCQSVAMPALEEACYQEPCAAVSWKSGPWGACQAGGQSRNVTCVDASNNPAQPADCTSQLGFTAPSTRPCNLFTCKTAANCSNNGICNLQTSSCECSSWYAGISCNIFKGPCNATATPDTPAPAPAVLSPSPSNPQYCCATGIVDYKGACCASGLVGGSGSCCPLNSQLDLYGECCTGKLDACGQCAGTGVAVDFLGTCCSGSLDAGGICCPAPLSVDDYGVCGGKSTTGIMALSMLANAQDLATSTAAVQEFNMSYTGLLAYTFDVKRSQVVLQDTQDPAPIVGRRPGQLLPSSGRRLTMIEEPKRGRSLLEHVTVSTEVLLYPPYGSLSYAEALSLLAANSGLITATDSSIQLGSLQLASTQGLSGNMVCEVGELPGAAADGQGDTSDCQLVYKPVPVGNNNTACSGHGRAIYAQGACECWVGYEGNACQTCAPGYQASDDLCLRTFNSFQGYTVAAAAPSPRVAGASVVLPLSLAVVGAITVFAVASIFVARHKRRRLVASPCERVDSGYVWAFTDPDGGSVRSSSQGRQMQPARGVRRSSPLALNSRPLAHLLGWLADNGFASDQVEVHPRGPSASSSSPDSLAAGRPVARGLFNLRTSEHSVNGDSEAALQQSASLRGVFNLHTSEHSLEGGDVPDVLGIAEVTSESARAAHARALIYTADLSDAGSEERTRQRNITWSQDIEGAEGVRSDNPVNLNSRHTFTYSLEQAEGEETAAGHRGTLPEREVDASMNSFSSSVSAIPAAPQFRPIPAFVPVGGDHVPAGRHSPLHSGRSLHSSRSSLATPHLKLVETAPMPTQRPASGRCSGQPARAATAFWPRLPWETGSNQGSRDTSESLRWIP